MSPIGRLVDVADMTGFEEAFPDSFRDW